MTPPYEEIQGERNKKQVLEQLKIKKEIILVSKK